MTEIKITTEEFNDIKSNLPDSSTVKDLMIALKQFKEFKRYDVVAERKLLEIKDYFNSKPNINYRNIDFLSAEVETPSLTQDNLLFLFDRDTIYDKFFKFIITTRNNKINLSIILDYDRRGQIVELIK